MNFMHDQQHEKIYSHSSSTSTIFVRVGIVPTSVILIVFNHFPNLKIGYFQIVRENQCSGYIITITL